MRLFQKGGILLNFIKFLQYTFVDFSVMFLLIMALVFICLKKLKISLIVLCILVFLYSVFNGDCFYTTYIAIEKGIFISEGLFQKFLTFVRYTYKELSFLILSLSTIILAYKGKRIISICVISALLLLLIIFSFKNWLAVSFFIKIGIY